MDAPPEAASAPTAVTRQRRRIALIWLVPLVTLAIAAWLAWDTYSKRGPTITIAFDSGDGLQPGQSHLKFKDVPMGKVTAIAVSPDLSKVIVTVETTREAERLLTDKTIFWIVKPQLFAGRVSGLDTLLSGSYIGMLPSAEGGTAQRHFIGSAEPPILSANEPGTVFKLETKKLGSLSLGSPIFYRDIDVGTVLGWDLAEMARHVTIHAFVRAPFDQYVHEDSLFWNASGVSFKLGVNGIQVQMESVKALLLGGIAFDTRRYPTSPRAEAGQVFPLYANQGEAQAAGFGRRLRLKSYFEGSVSGLEIGADVTLHGLKIGEVTDVGLVYEPKLDRIVAPVHYRVEGARIAGIAGHKNVPMGTVAAEMVSRGFRATLESASLLTGQKVVALQVVPDAPAAELTHEGDVFIVPTASVGGFDSITRSAGELLAKINNIDWTGIGSSIVGAGKGLDDVINGPQLKGILASLEAAMKDIADFSHKLDVEGGPALARLPRIAAELEDGITKISRLATSLNAGYGSNSRFNREIDRLMPQLNEAARSFRALADLLARHPEALIRGRTGSGRE